MTTPNDPQESVAIALKHAWGRPEAPTIVAKGRGALAEQILALAFEHGIKVRQDRDLAEILSVVDIDTTIPIEAFQAVAEILAYVYITQRKVLPPEGVR